MRTISAQALATIGQPIGIEPVTIIAINARLGYEATERWHYFADTNRSGQEYTGVNPFNGQVGPIPGTADDMVNDPEAFLLGLDGLIASVAPYENIQTQGTTNSSVSVELYDTGDLFRVGPNINNRPAKIIQWFKGIPLADAFTLFDGRINTPFTYDYAEQRVSLTIVSWLEDREVGFSVEEGDFDYVPPRMVGRNWPLVFGTAYKVPAIQIVEIAKPIVADTYSVNNYGGQGGNAVDSNLAAMHQANRNAQECFDRADELRRVVGTLPAEAYVYHPSFDGGFPGIAEAFQTAELDFIAGGVGQSRTARGRMNIEIRKLYDQGNAYLLEAQRAGEASRQGFGGSEGSQLGNIRLANGDQLPQNRAIQFVDRNGKVIHGVVANGEIVVDRFDITNSVLDAASRLSLTRRDTAVVYEQDVVQNNLYVVPSGTVLRLKNGYAAEYIACLLHCAVLGVWANRRFGGESVLWPVPEGYYRVEYVTYGTPPDASGLSDQHVTATKIIFDTPLSSRVDATGTSEEWDDNIFVDLTSPVGPEVTQVLTFLIDTYTDYIADPASFSAAKDLMLAYPVNFAVLERRNIVTLLNDIAYQSRCAIWSKDEAFYLKYLPISTPVVDTITQAVIEAGSERMVYEPSSDAIVTKLTVNFNVDYGGNRPGGSSGFRRTLKVNARKYGVHAREETYIIYNDDALVQKSALFWLNRLGQQYKILECNVFLDKMRLETYDYVTLSHPLIADVPVTAMVLSCAYDSAANKLTLRLWTPVRPGERTPYPFAFPATLPSTQVYAGSAFYGNFTNPLEDYGSRSRVKGSLLTGGPTSYGLTSNNQVYQDSGTNLDRFGNLLPPSENWGPSDTGNAAPVPPTFLRPGAISVSVGEGTGSAHVQVFDVPPLPPRRRPQDIPGAFPGVVVSGPDGDGGAYTVEMYCFGLDGEIATISAKPFKVLDDDPVTPGSSVIVYKVVRDGEDTTFVFQPFVWAAQTSN